jgi:hypothetical protein
VRLNLALYGDDAINWEKLLKSYGNARGAKMQAFRDAVAAALNGPIITPEAALRVLEDMVKERGQ